MADNTKTVAEIAIGVEGIIHSGFAEGYADHYVTVLDKGIAEDGEESWTVLQVQDRTGRVGTLALPHETLIHIYA